MSLSSINPRFCCPITLSMMTAPVTTPCGHTFDKAPIESILAAASPTRFQVNCPTCRAPIPASWMPVINYDLKSIIEEAMTATATATATCPATAAISPFVETPLTVTASRITGTSKMHVRISTPADATPLPVDATVIGDISGSMGSRATEQKPLKPGEKEEASTLLSRNDLTVHSIRALIQTLTAQDRLTVIGFDTHSELYLAATPMDATGKALAESRISRIQPRGGTSFWAGLKAGLDTMATNYRPNRNTVIVFETDGESDPSYDPPLGILPTLRAWKERHADLKFTLHVIGYGYGANLQMGLLRKIAEICDGTVSYVPDGSVLAQVTIHLFANLMTCTHTGVRVTNDDAVTRTLGFVQAGQTRDLIMEATASVTVGDITVPVTDATDSTDSTDALAKEMLITALKQGLEKGVLSASLKRDLESLPTTPYITGLLTDIEDPDLYKGQIGKAFLPLNFKRWGQHYLPGILSAHENQWETLFKGEGDKFYPPTQTKEAITKGVDIYDTLPPIMASFQPGSDSHLPSAYSQNAQPTYVTPSSQNAGGCFTASTLVLMYDGSLKRMDMLQKGDRVHGNHQIICMVRYLVDGSIPIVYLGAAGLTELHPIRTEAGWIHPRSVEPPVRVTLQYIYNVVLATGHILKFPVKPTIDTFVEACSLAHNFEGPIISHTYFGKRVEDMPNVMDDILKSRGYSKGYITWKNVKHLRDENGEIYAMQADEA